MPGTFRRSLHSVRALALAGAFLVLAMLVFAARSPAAESPPAGQAAGPGQVVVQWKPIKGPARRFARSLRSSGVIERVAATINSRYVLPNDIPVVFNNWRVLSEVGPVYIPTQPKGPKISFISFPGSFLTLEIDVLRKELRGIKWLKPGKVMISANEFVIAHEIGHALVDQLDIPITGREEDAVDGFAAYLLGNTPYFGPRAALSAAILFAGLSHRPTAADFADQHSLTQQRVYQFLCWVYGSDPKEFKDLVGRGGLPHERAVECPAEWKQLNSSWSRLLAPYEARAG